MTAFAKQGVEIWRDYEMDEVPISGVHNVIKPDMRAWMLLLEGLNTGPLAGFRNHLFNGCMRINQRGATSVADDTYCFDRWYVLAQTGNVTVGAQTLIEHGWANAIRLTQANADGSSNHRIGLAQIVEAANCQHLRNQVVTLSKRVQYSQSANLRIAILEWTGTADIITSDMVNDWTSAAYTAGNFFISPNLAVRAVAQKAVIANTPATIEVSATLGTSLNNVIVLVWTEATAPQNATLDIGKCQLEPTSIATDFERRPIQTELALCQRYALVLGDGVTGMVVGAGKCDSGTQAQIPLPLAVPMRATPSGGFSANSDWVVLAANGSGITVTGLSLNGSSKQSRILVITVASGLSAGDATQLQTANASGTLTLTCEL